MRFLLPAVLLVSGCAAAPFPPRPAAANSPGAYTPTPQAARPVGGISTNCVFDANGLGAACRPLDNPPQGPIPPISAGQPR